jgi:putative peptidoglycan lipid II flippase
MIPSCWSRREACGLQAVTLVVPDYDAGTAFFVGKPRFGLIGDAPHRGGKRRVMAAPRGGETRRLLAEGKGERQRAAIGNQAGGRVGFFLETDDFGRAPAAFVQRGVTFTDAPRQEDYGKVAVFRGDFGNLRDLIQYAS